ncbi:three prime repair exonuclease 4 [Syngnathoides biaculeatus]|uniref:three prime repair exonuclease 4 n=1 Tax=Syngnathoides biaculeatus TaxID=300417 RepID=UPI002ADDB999|nr:three prime repair exonuclease 4 [Syngnathoides biaculeatus]
MQTSGENDFSQPPVVFFDLETTGLGPACELVQLAAMSGGHSLNLYTVPRCRMEPGAARVTGLRVRRQKLYLRRRPVPTRTLREVLLSFVAFLRSFGRPLLAGHNIRRFDCRPLARALDETGLRAEFEASVAGFLDTLPLAREVLKECGMSSFKQEYLVKELMGVVYKVHDALEDVRSLQMLFNVLQPKPDVVARYTFSLSDVQDTTGAPKAERLLPGQRLLWQHLEQQVKETDGEAEGHHSM